jgi:hypothetical protein
MDAYQADHTVAITKFSATVNCGALPDTWTYSGFDYKTGLPLNIALD